jgi:hypothetical protein
MNTRVGGNGYLKLQLSNEEMEQLKYCVSKVVKDFDTYDPYALNYSQEELEQFAKRVKKTTKPNADGPGVEFDMHNLDLARLLVCALEISRVYPQHDQDSNKPTVKQLDRLCDRLVKLIDQTVD